MKIKKMILLALLVTFFASVSIAEEKAQPPAQTKAPAPAAQVRNPSLRVQLIVIVPLDSRWQL